ncbi:flavin-dependent oxidoreductase [Nocardia jinanensis]|uniref:Flavin-dependent oxidoreductase n=1 Tax=Nocardia jinanensis TaxID=382504 RepID=A0A917RQZ0_9NOCA|nr:flavin-dependent oxidoreductase [Nocardia jinanensis]GGL20247.1 flavin-dependent oxidoreductase [Nocardia jinanensis]
MRVLIVGAGIGGLTTALSLHAAGIEAQVIDRVQTLRPLGVGINLLPHATGALAELGLHDALAAQAVATSELVHYDKFGNEIWREPRGVAAGHPWPQYSVHRGRLQALLLDAVLGRLGPGAVRTGYYFATAVQEDRRVRVTVEERDTGTAVELTADAVIGADGLHSGVRAHLYPDEGPPRWNGIRMWRGVATAPRFLSGTSMLMAGGNHAAKLVAYPIGTAAPGDDDVLVNWVAEVRMPQDTQGEAEWTRAGRLDDVLPHYRGWRIAGLDAAALLAASEPLLEYPMVDRDPLPRWSFGRITLLGDAAHPMYPVGSNGGSQAILDARAVAAGLAGTGDPVAGLAAYETARREQANAVVLANRDIPMDRILRVVAERAPAGFDRIQDVLTDAELGAITEGYRRTSAIR